MKTWPNWIRASLEPDELIGEHEMRRWWLLPRNRWFNVFLHEHQADDSRFLHDHPCDSISIRLRGELVEYRPTRPRYWETTLRPLPSEADGDPTRWIWGPEGAEFVQFTAAGVQLDRAHAMPRIRIRHAEEAHRLELVNGRRAWTLWIRFSNRRRWGFFEPAGWRPAASARQTA